MHSYNRYLAAAARVVRRSLKEGPRLQAERRGEMDLRFAKWEVSTVCTNASYQRLTLHSQNGKQGENKSLASENASAMAQSAGQEAK
jgi:F-type H+-transporting ATPase subunit epsilon